MSKAAVCLALVLCFPTLAQQKKKNFDQQLAQFAAELGTNRIARYAKDHKGKLLLRLSLAVDPDNTQAHLTLGLLESGKKVTPVKTRIDEARFLKGTFRRAENIRKRAAATDKELGKRALLYYLVVHKFQPNNEKAALGPVQLGKLGIKGELDELLAGAKAVDAETAAEPEEQPAAQLEPEAAGTIDPKQKYADAQAPKEWIQFAMERDKHGLKKQTEIIFKKYSQICPREKYKTKTGLEVQGGVPEVASANGSETEIFRLQIDGNGTFNTFWPLFGIPLTHLTVTNVRGAELDFAPLSMAKLEVLTLHRAEELEHLKNLDKTPIKGLELRTFERFHDLRELKGTKIEALLLEDCHKLTKLTGLEKLPLKRLEIINSRKIRDLDPLRKLQLTAVRLENLESLRSIKALEGQPIEGIAIEGCDKLSERDMIASLRKMPKLKRIHGVDDDVVKKVLQE